MFIILLYRYLCGYIKFKAYGGFFEQFLNLVSKSDITLWSVKRKGEYLSAKIYARQYKRLRHCAKKSGMRLKVMQRHGIPFIIHRYRKRIGIPVGVGIFFLMLWFMSLFVWSIDVKGNVNVPTGEILETLSELGLKPCVLKSSLDIRHIQNEACLKLPSLAWLAINQKGSCVVIEVKERVETPEIVPHDRPCNIIAAHDGQVIRVEAYDGQAVVKAGDAVSKGDLLISGVVQDKRGIITKKHARGKVYARTKREFSERVSFVQQKRVPTSKVASRIRLRLFGKIIPLYLRSEPNGHYNVDFSNMRANIFGFKPPIGYSIERYRKVEIEEYEVSQDQAVSLAREAIKEKIKAQIPEAKIISVQEQIEVKDDEIVLTQTLVCEEDIGKESEIFINFDDKL